MNAPEAKPDEHFMRLAIDLAAKAGDAGEVPVGALVVNGGEVIAQGANSREATPVSYTHLDVYKRQSLEGVTALLAMLASCAPGICVVGIDNGFGAAWAVARILRKRSHVLDGAAHNDALVAH